MKTVSHATRGLGTIGRGGIALRIPAYVPAEGSPRETRSSRRTTALEGLMERRSPLGRIAAWTVYAATAAVRFIAAYVLPSSRDPVPGWDPIIKCWNQLGVPYDKARPPNPKVEAHHSHGRQTDF